MTVRAVILAAGQGTRMRSKLPKVLADVAGRPMISWVVDAVAGIDPGQIMVVVGHGADHVADVLPDHAGWCIQDELLGTGDAARVGLAALGSVEEDIVLILNGDAPLLTSATLADLVSMQRRTNAAVTLLTAEMPDPTGYGRVLRDERGRVVGVVEHGDAAPGQLGIREINAGMYAFRGDLLPAALDQLKADNVQGEFYLTDVISVLAEEGYSLGALRTSADEIFGVNSHDQLAEASRLMRRQIASRWMEEGVWVQDPDRTYLGPDVTLEPGVRLYPGVHLEGRTHIAAGAVVGPDVFATDTVIGGESRSSGMRCCAAPWSATSARWGLTPRSGRGASFGTARRWARSSRPRARRWGRARRCPTSPIWGTPRWARTPTSAPAPSPATTTDTASREPWLATAPSSDPTRCWLRR